MTPFLGPFWFSVAYSIYKDSLWEIILVQVEDIFQLLKKQYSLCLTIIETDNRCREYIEILMCLTNNSISGWECIAPFTTGGALTHHRLDIKKSPTNLWLKKATVCYCTVCVHVSKCRQNITKREWVREKRVTTVVCCMCECWCPTDSRAMAEVWAQASHILWCALTHRWQLTQHR